MKDFRYDINMLSCWHCGSGLSAGADLDMLVIKNSDGLPYIPGRTFKGLMRDAVEDYMYLQGKGSEEIFVSAFGTADTTPAKPEEIVKGEAFFTDAVMDEAESQYITEKRLQRFLFEKLTTTAIDKDGVAVDHSLRAVEAAVPMKLSGHIYNVSDEMAEIIKKAAGMIKRLGLSRSRGLGRCNVTITEEGGQK